MGNIEPRQRGISWLEQLIHNAQETMPRLRKLRDISNLLRPMKSCAGRLNSTGNKNGDAALFGTHKEMEKV
jgi:hypothetical protein